MYKYKKYQHTLMLGTRLASYGTASDIAISTFSYPLLFKLIV